MKPLFIISTLLLGAQFCGAQTFFKAGLRAGASTSQVAGDGLAGFDKFGASAGAYLKVGLEGPWSLEFDMLYVNKGSKKNADQDNGDFEVFKMQLNYIEMPVFVKYELENQNFEFGAGPYIGRLIGAKEIFNGLELEPVVPFNDWDLGIGFSGAYLFSEQIHGEIRYTQSINSLRPVPQGQPFVRYDGRQYHSVIQVMMGYSF